MSDTSGTAPARRPAPTLHVVLVEDHPGYREQLRELIQALHGVQVVHTADNDRDAVAWLAANPHRWNLLVLDIFLAEGHGFKVLRACAQRQPHQRAVFLTSYTRDPAQAQALALGADAVFNKVDVGDFLRYLTQQRDAQRQPACA